MDRETAYGIVTEFVKNDGLVRHMLSVEAAMRAYAIKFGEDPEPWGLAGLLHDSDWEIHPTLEQHPQAGARSCASAVCRRSSAASRRATPITPASPVRSRWIRCSPPSTSSPA